MAGYAEKAAAVLELWATKRFDTSDISWILDMHEANVERIIHADRELRRQARKQAVA